MVARQTEREPERRNQTEKLELKEKMSVIENDKNDMKKRRGKKRREKKRKEKKEE